MCVCVDDSLLIFGVAVDGSGTRFSLFFTRRKKHKSHWQLKSTNPKTEMRWAGCRAVDCRPPGARVRSHFDRRHFQVQTLAFYLSIYRKRLLHTLNDGPGPGTGVRGFRFCLFHVNLTVKITIGQCFPSRKSTHFRLAEEKSGAFTEARAAFHT